MGRDLAPHLRHAAGVAWFDPISLVAELPASLEVASEEEKLAYMHEHVHFVQSVTTFYGANRLHTFLKNLRALQAEFKLCGGSVEKLNRHGFLATFNANLHDLSFVTSDAHGSTTLKVDACLDGLHMIDDGVEKYLGFCWPTSENHSRFFNVGAISIQESQAMAIERILGGDSADNLYDAAVAASDNSFQYAVISESLRKRFPSWSKLSILLTTVIVCDISLNDYIPRRVMPFALEWLRQHFSSAEPTMEDLSAIHSGISSYAHSEYVEEERVKLYSELHRAADTATSARTEADQLFPQMISLYVKGHELRKKNPHVFVALLMRPDVEPEQSVLPFSGLPLYQTSRGLLTCSSDENLIRSCMAFLALSHFVNYLTTPNNKKECPFLNRPGACTWTKTECCSTSPWLKEAEENMGCVYRFAADAVGVSKP